VGSRINFGSGDSPIGSEFLRDLKTHPELLALNDRKPQSPSALFAIARCLSNIPVAKDPIRMRGCEQSIASVEAIDLSKANGDCGFWLGESIPSLAVSTVWHNKGIAGQSPPVRCPCSSVSSDAPDATGDLAGQPDACMFCAPLEKLIVAQDTGLRFVCNPPKVRRPTIKRAERLMKIQSACMEE
jgi:hypothetical protein